MCLTRIDKVYKGKSRKVYRGYKVFWALEDRLYSEHCSKGNPLTQNEWLNERAYRVSSNIDYLPISYIYEKVDPRESNKYYPVGWHVYQNEDDAIQTAMWENEDNHRDFSSEEKSYITKGRVVKEIECKGLLAKGLLDGRKVWVFKYIKILEV